MLVDAMFTLLQTVPYSEITVRRLTDTARVSRQTFYALFATREEVIQRRIQQVFDEYRAALATRVLTIHSLVALFFAFYSRNQAIFNPLLANGLTNILTESARECIATLKLTDMNHSYYVNGFVAAGLTQLLVDWSHRQDITVDDAIRLTERLIDASVLVTRDSGA